MDHLSVKEWWDGFTGGASNLIGKALDQRTDPPTCDGKAPDWVDETIFLQDQNAPMLVCVGRDPNDTANVTVKVANNRGGALIVKAPARPAWAHHARAGGGVIDLPADMLTTAVETLAVGSAQPDRTWILLPGDQIHIGLTRAQVTNAGSPANVTGQFSTSSVAFGVVAKAILDALDDKTTFNGWDTALLVACGQAAFAADNLVTAIFKLASCAVEQPEVIIEALRKATGSVPDGTYRVATIAKRVVARYLMLGEVVFTAADLLTTLNVDPAALKIALFAKRLIPPGAVVLTADGVGPIRFGMTIVEAAAALGTALPDNGSSCRETAKLPGLNLVERQGRIIGAAVFTSQKPHTDTGIALGDSLNELRAAYRALKKQPSCCDTETTDYVFTAPTGRKLVFSVWDDKVGSMSGGADVGGEPCAG